MDLASKSGKHLQLKEHYDRNIKVRQWSMLSSYVIYYLNIF